MALASGAALAQALLVWRGGGRGRGGEGVSLLGREGKIIVLVAAQYDGHPYTGALRPEREGARGTLRGSERSGNEDTTIVVEGGKGRKKGGNKGHFYKKEKDIDNFAASILSERFFSRLPCKRGENLSTP